MEPNGKDRTERALLAAAIFGLITISAGAGAWFATQRPMPYNTTKIERITIARGQTDRGCVEGIDNRGSDLCAQWKAADAARDAATWAEWGVFTSIAAAVGVIVALLLTIDSNRIARNTAKQQLRAYVAVETANIRFKAHPVSEKRDCLLSINWKNVGQTPAHNLQTEILFGFADRGWRGYFSGSLPTLARSKISLAPTCVTQIVDAALKISEYEQWQLGKRDLFIFAKVTYIDAFDTSQVTKNRWCVRGDEKGSLVLQPQDIDNVIT